MLDLVSELGGAQHSLFDLCTTLPQNGVEMVAAVPRGPLYDKLAAAGIQVFPLSPVRARRHGWHLFTSAAKLARSPASVSQIVRAVKPDILHCNNLTAFLTARSHCSRLPVIWHVRDLQLPVPLARDAAKRAARLFAISGAVDEYLVEILSPRSLGHIRMIRNGIDPERFRRVTREAARNTFDLPQKAPVIGMVAHMSKWKRHDAFIATAGILAKQLPEAHFVIVGRDLFNEHTRWQTQLNTAIETLGLAQRFHWITHVDATETILPAFDVLLHPALGEPFGRVICEAMAARVPVVAAESGGPAKLIQPNKTGLLIRDGNPQDMAEATLALLADPSQIRDLTEAANAFVEETYTVKRMCDQTAEAYRALLTSYVSHGDEA